jgi:hypothetical protein
MAMNAVVSPPVGIKQVVPLDKTHRVQLVPPGMAPAFSLGLHAVPLGASELVLALRDYPIVFLQQRPDQPLEAVAILGMHEGQNLYVMPDGRWDRRTYIPAFIRRYPFSIACAPSGARTICVDPTAVVENGEAMFDPAGAPLQHWTMFERLLHEYEDELNRARALGALLQRLGLLAPFAMRADLSGGFALSLEGMYRVERPRLAALDVAPLRDLINKGDMDCIYAHLLSQDNFLRLVARRGLFNRT